jgi:hypothetical protein
MRNDSSHLATLELTDGPEDIKEQAPTDYTTGDQSLT